MIKKIVLIGAGNVATHLGSALCGAGCDVVQVYSRTKESAMELADKLSAEYTVSVDGIRCHGAQCKGSSQRHHRLQILHPGEMQLQHQMQFTVTAPPVKMQFRNARRRF